VTVFVVSSAVTASISGLTIQHGKASVPYPGDDTRFDGGGIINDGTLTVTNSTLSDNTAIEGGGIYNGGTLTVTNSTLSGNSASNQGGGIFNDVTLTVANSTLSANNTSDGGGGVYNNGTATVTNSTLSANSAAIGGGGGVYNNGPLTVTNSTISGNRAIFGGGIRTDGGTVTLTDTIVAGNTATDGGPDLGGYASTGGHNLFGTTADVSITLGPSDLVNPTPLLAPLGSNGGPTRTIALLPGSPAIDAGSDAACAAAPVGGKDQRGIARPLGAHCDIGAFEYQVVNPLPPTKPSVPVGGGAPSPLPAVRPAAPAGGPAPNPLPVSRP
jgi:hypothetical protein